MAGKDRWPEKTGGRKRQVAGKERWPEKTGGRKKKCGRKRKVALKER